MAAIQEKLTLYDDFSKTFTTYIRLGEQAAGVTKETREAVQDLTQTQNQAAKSTNSLTSSVTSLVKGYLGLKGLKATLELSDTIANTTARLNMMNDGLQTTAELNDQIYASALRTGSSYAETANLVAQLGIQAGEAFSSTQEILQFAEQINKQIVLSGASSQAASAAIYQLTQGLSSGTLRGEELNSVLEQTPLIGKTIAEYLGVSTGEMRELASEGKLTADVVKSALLSAADETNEAFAQMPMTWSRLWENAKTIATQALQPVLNVVGQIAGIMADNSQVVISAFLGIAAAVGVYTAAQWVATGAAKAFFTTLKSNPVILAVSVAVGVLISAISALVQKMGGLKVAWLTVVDAVLYAWDGLKAGIAEGVNWVLTNWENMTIKTYEQAVKIQNFVGDLKVGVLEILQDMVNGAIGIINDFIEMLNNIPGVSIEPIKELTFATTAKLENEAEKQLRNDMLTTAQEAFAANQEARQRQLDFLWAEREGAHLARQQEIAAAKTTSTDTATMWETPDYTAQLDEINAGVQDVSKSVNLAEEDIQSLVDVAERQYVNRINLTAQSPVISVNGQNTGNTQADRRQLAATIRDIIVSEASAGSTRYTTRPA